MGDEFDSIHKNIKENTFHKSRAVPQEQKSTKNIQDDHISEALKTYSGDKEQVSADHETEEDIKTILLEDVDELRYELEQDQIDVSRIPQVNKDSSLEDVKKIRKILRMKYDRKRCDSFGTEIIMASAQGLEYLFDGKKKWGPYRPDLLGWSNTIRPKLRRMKYETSTIIASVMQEYNIGPMARIGLELIPSAILYSRMRREQHGKANYSPDQMSEALEDLRQFD